MEQFCDLLVVILIIAALISMVSGNVESTVVILAVIILNAILGTVQHAKAGPPEKLLEILPFPNAKVLRDGQKVGDSPGAGSRRHPVPGSRRSGGG